ncbi:carboxypeptidase-like regulatory domain-containing protein [Nakamurella lactea]|uniref:carboxypeptidase-like regulatory domain-containing protein n=1 Tax=Nakamurella lactea TaxID=459515 RepID=UPI000420AEC9|nr:carboxypeptidase-like regulatory domain-containing protein [Nakamurella lactea]
MRVSADTDLIDLKPGGTAEVGLDVVNTGQVIDGVTARIVGLPDRHVSTRPAVLPLFPDSAGRMTLVVGVPNEFPAGVHPVTVEVRSRQSDTAPSYLDLDLKVPQSAAMELTCRPQVVRTHRTARFVLTVHNRGNVTLDVSLQATDPERAVDCRTEPSAATVPAGGAVDVVISARAPRMLLGSELDRPINVTATGHVVAPGRAPRLPVPVGAPLDPLPEPADSGTGSDAEPLTAGRPLTVRQRPWLTRGLMTALILLAIIAVWAAVFLFGIGQVFGGDPLTKSAPPSYFVAPAPALAAQQNPSDGAAAAAPAAAGRGAGTAAAAAGPVRAEAPADALPKDGSLPPGTAGGIGGTITAKADGAGIARILVEAVRPTSTGKLVVASSAASQADGSYEISGLFPGPYLLRFSADGFTPVYFPGTASAGKAKQLQVGTGSVITGTDMVLSGKPATISGTVDPGDTVERRVTVVSARPIGAASTSKPVATAKTDAAGKYTLKKLPAPATYELSFTTKGYQASSAQVTVDGGANRIQPNVVLNSGLGEISGTVTDASGGVGQATVSTTVRGVDVTTGTPTTGTPGQFVIGDLPTPATYVLTVTAEGYAPSSVVVDLGPGQKLTGQKVELVKGTGQVSGRLVAADGTGLGGATVTVGGGADLPGTTTLTSGEVGSFALDKLPNPGSYTLTFTLAGYLDTTVPVTLDGAKAIDPLTVTMTSSMGRITGRILGPGGAPVADATVVATDGIRTWPVTSAASAGVVPAGGYVISGLAAGTYTVTATGPDGEPHTALVTVAAGSSATQDFAVSNGGG